MDIEFTGRKRDFIIIAATCALVGLFWIIKSCDWDWEKYQVKRQAKARVSVIFKGIRKGEKGTEYVENPEQVSICQWYNNTFLITDFGELSRASDAFDQWRMQGSIFTPIERYTVDEVEIIEGSNPVTTLVYGTVNGLNYILRVPERGTISWEQTPSFIFYVDDDEDDKEKEESE